ncbi:MAG: recombinase family protein [Aminipila sp.]
MNSVAIYCRLSDEDKIKENNQDSESIQNQKNLLMEYAIDQGWEIYKLYSDDDWSGMDSERPEWNKMLLEAKNRQFNIVLCKSQSRFTRDMEMVEKYLHTLFPLWGIRFVGFADNADTDNKGNKKSRQINGLVNEWYCEDISENIKVVFDKKRRDGLYIGGIAPFGLMKDTNSKGKLVVDPEAAFIVRRIFSLYLDGFGSMKIAKLFNDEGIPNPTKYKNMHGVNWKKEKKETKLGLWTGVTVRRILKNRMYIGDMVQGVHRKVSYKSKKCVLVPEDEWYIVENTHEAIIDRETFELVQKLIDSKRRSDGTGKPHVLAGKIKCADCGSTMIRFTPNDRSGNSLPYKYLRCGMIDKKTGKCTGHYIRFDKLEQLILFRLKEYFRNINERALEDRCKEISVDNKPLKSIDSQLSDIDKEINKRKQTIEVLYMDRVNGHITVQQWSEMNSSFEKQLGILLNRKSVLQQEKDTEASQQDRERLILDKIRYYKNIDKLDAKVVNEFIDYITIGEKNKDNGTQAVNIKWRY